MKYVKVAACLASMFLIMVAGSAWSEGPKRVVFSCSVGIKTVTVTYTKDIVTYSFGTPEDTELVISGSKASQNVFYRSDRFAGPEQQLRFTRDGFSYIVYSMEANSQTGSKSASGLMVLEGKARISDKPCRPHAAFTAFDFDFIPEDSDEYAAMSL